MVIFHWMIRLHFLLRSVSGSVSLSFFFSLYCKYTHTLSVSLSLSLTHTHTRTHTRTVDATLLQKRPSWKHDVIPSSHIPPSLCPPSLFIYTHKSSWEGDIFNQKRKKDGSINPATPTTIMHGSPFACVCICLHVCMWFVCRHMHIYVCLCAYCLNVGVTWALSYVTVAYWASRCKIFVVGQL